MRYATWKLKFDETGYGIGPEQAITELGGSATGSFSIGDIQSDGLIVGYVDADLDASSLSEWEFSFVTQEAALSLALELNEAATLDESGFIVMPMPGQNLGNEN